MALNENKQYEILDNVEYPEDIKQLSLEQLLLLANEMRDFILHSVSKTGGHLASNLGSVELTIALHYVYNTPDDLLVWDVGHQSYPHKILTGRKKQMCSIRKINGLAGFPVINESVYDTFGVGHSSTSISAALGMEIANRIINNNWSGNVDNIINNTVLNNNNCLNQDNLTLNEQYKSLTKRNSVVAIIGDGSITAGLAFEGLNNSGWLGSNLLVILNDNEMSISENVGAIRRYLSKILLSRFYNSVKTKAIKITNPFSMARKLTHRIEEYFKGIVYPNSTLFEEFGFNYIGPIDGHNLADLIDALKNIKMLDGPQFLHIVTKKGYGYKLAEHDPIAYHGVGKFDLLPHNQQLDEDNISQNNPQKANYAINHQQKIGSYSDLFGFWLCNLATIINKANHEKNLKKKFVAITPAMREGSGMVEFAKLFPELFFDVGIAEQHALTFAAGVATRGVVPIVAIYSTFLQRAYDQLIHDIAIQNLHVILAIDRAGIVGADGVTHHGVFDISFLRAIPNIVIMTPSNMIDCYEMFFLAFNLKRPIAIRYPRGSLGASEDLNHAINQINQQFIDYIDQQAQNAVALKHENNTENIANNVKIKPRIELGKGHILRFSKRLSMINQEMDYANSVSQDKIVIFCFGTLLNYVNDIQIINSLDPTICDMRYAKPLDESLIQQLAKSHDYIVTLEDGVLLGGAGSACLELLNDCGIIKPILRLGIPDRLVYHGDQNIIYANLGLDNVGILARIQKFIIDQKQLIK